MDSNSFCGRGGGDDCLYACFMRHILRRERLGAGDVDSVVYWVTTIQVIVGRRRSSGRRLLRARTARPHACCHPRISCPCASTLHLQLEIEIEMTVLTAGEGYAEANLPKNVAGKIVFKEECVSFRFPLFRERGGIFPG